MSGEGFTIVSDVPHRLIRIKVTGLWDRATADRFQVAILSAFDRMQTIHKRYNAIFDMIDFAVLPAALATAMQEFWKTIGENGPEKVAVVINHALLRLQNKRLSPETLTFIRRFTDEATAMEWLGQKS
jgi:hypothetical protein